eukprot:SAG31_NODE_1798_length_7243_cov_4.509518_2_plen_70_part_00
MHNDYSVAPERTLVTQEMLSPWALQTQQKLNINKDTCKKLVPSLSIKCGYVADVRNLKYYMRLGLKELR